MNPLDFSGKTVLVVGGSSGIGNGIAHAFRDAGATVHVWGTRESAADYSSEEGSNLFGLYYSQVDVSNQAAIEAHQTAFDGLDALVLAQGIVIYGRGEFDMQGFSQVIAVNLNSVMACSIKFRGMLARNRGSIITIGSTAAFRATLGNPAYNASKAGMLGLTRTLATAWIKDGIRVNGIAPGLVRTKLTKVTMDDRRRRDLALQRIPMGRLGTPADIAGVALFLASSLSSYIIGQTIPVDGGLILG